MIDEDILAWAVREQRVILTTDNDFEQMIWQQQKPHCGVLRLENVPRKEREVLLDDALQFHSQDLQEGDILWNSTGTGTIGRAAIFQGLPEYKKAVVDSHLIKVRFNPTQIAKYALWWLLSDDGRRQITLVASSTSGLHPLSLSKVSALPIPLLPLEEQQEIVRRIESLFKLADNIEQQYQQAEIDLETINQSILAKAFRGELVPQDPNDEPASVLLERIRAEREKAKPKKSKSKKKSSSKKQDKQLGIPGM